MARLMRAPAKVEPRQSFAEGWNPWLHKFSQGFLHVFSAAIIKVFHASSLLSGSGPRISQRKNAPFCEFRQLFEALASTMLTMLPQSPVSFTGLGLCEQFRDSIMRSGLSRFEALRTASLKTVGSLRGLAEWRWGRLGNLLPPDRPSLSAGKPSECIQGLGRLGERLGPIYPISL